jgi:hypothetical protein
MNKHNIYYYVGSEEIKLSVSNFTSGTIIRSISDMKNWIKNNYSKKVIDSDLIVATFVIDMNGDLRLADRHSEHVACAGGQPVMSAGEIFINRNKNSYEVSDITNQSTGYCPEIESWEYVELALNKIHITHPSRFTSEFTFRRCDSCSQINIIKDDLFACSVCNSNLSYEWNFQ